MNSKVSVVKVLDKHLPESKEEGPAKIGEETTIEIEANSFELKDKETINIKDFINNNKNILALRVQRI